MADQVNPAGSLASGLPLALLAAAAPRPAPESSRPAKIADSQPGGSGSQAAIVSAESSEGIKSPEAAMARVNNYLQQSGSELKFKVDKESGRTVFKVINPNTGEVLLQVPSEELLALARNLRSFEKQTGASGVLVDKEG